MYVRFPYIYRYIYRMTKTNLDDPNPRRSYRAPVGIYIHAYMLRSVRAIASQQSEISVRDARLTSASSVSFI